VTLSELRESATNVADKAGLAMVGALYLTETPYSTDSVDEIIDPKVHAKSAWIIGRDTATSDIVCHDRTVSRQHAKLTHGAGIFSIEDLGSANGTNLNNSRVLPFSPVSLSETGIICIGRVSLHFKVR
jgi:pSer/pThr/pTyr-binding forkhead associated (FHA) protein